MFSASCKAELPPSDGLSFGVGHEHSLQLDECQLWECSFHLTLNGLGLTTDGAEGALEIAVTSEGFSFGP